MEIVLKKCERAYLEVHGSGEGAPGANGGGGHGVGVVSREGVLLGGQRVAAGVVAVGGPGAPAPTAPRLLVPPESPGSSYNKVTSRVRRVHSTRISLRLSISRCLGSTHLGCHLVRLNLWSADSALILWASKGGLPLKNVLWAENQTSLTLVSWRSSKMVRFLIFFCPYRGNKFEVLNETAKF